MALCLVAKAVPGGCLVVVMLRCCNAVARQFIYVVTVKHLPLVKFSYLDLFTS